MGGKPSDRGAGKDFCEAVSDLRIRNFIGHKISKGSTGEVKSVVKTLSYD